MHGEHVKRARHAEQEEYEESEERVEREEGVNCEGCAWPAKKEERVTPQKPV